MPVPLAYFLTWRCYGTWLHGDPRGSVDDEHNLLGTPYIEQSRARYEYEESLLRAGPVTLSDDMRRLVERVVQDHCALRRWKVLALNVRTTHVHVVVSAAVTPDRIEGQLKAWASRRLREAGLIDQGAPVWARHGSQRWIWNDEGLLGAVDYVLNRQ